MRDNILLNKNEGEEGTVERGLVPSNTGDNR